MGSLSFNKLSYFLYLTEFLSNWSFISFEIWFDVVCLSVSVEEIKIVILNFDLCKYYPFRAHCVNIKILRKVMFIGINNRKPAQNQESWVYHRSTQKSRKCWEHKAEETVLGSEFHKLLLSIIEGWKDFLQTNDIKLSHYLEETIQSILFMIWFICLSWGWTQE